MKRAMLILCWIVGCHREQPTRIFQLRPLDRDSAIAIWGAEGGVDLRLGKLASDGGRGWSISLPEVNFSHASVAVERSQVFLSHRGRLFWVVDAFDVADGNRLWTSQIPALGDDPTMRIEEQGVVLWDSKSVAILARDSGQVRVNAAISTDLLTVTAKFVVVDRPDDVISFSIGSGSVARKARTFRGCADGSEYVTLDDTGIAVYSLADFAASQVAPTTRPMVIDSCGHYGESRVLTALVLDDARMPGTAVLVIDKGTITHTFEFPRDQVAFAGSSRWRGRAGLNGVLTRYVAIPSRKLDSKATHLFQLDLREMTAKQVASTDEPQSILFRVDTHWLWIPTSGVTPTLYSVDGESGTVTKTTLVATDVPQFLPDDVAASTLWMHTGKWTTGNFELTRLDSALNPLK